MVSDESEKNWNHVNETKMNHSNVRGRYENFVEVHTFGVAERWIYICCRIGIHRNKSRQYVVSLGIDNTFAEDLPVFH